MPVTIRRTNRAPNRSLRNFKFDVSRAKKKHYTKSKLTNSVKTYICPDMYFTKLVYSENVSIAYSLTNTVYQYNINNLNDPNRTGTGTQPLGHDQFATLYTKYRVFGCKYSFTFSNTNAGYNAEIVVQKRAGTDTSSTFESALQSAYAQYKCLGVQGSAGPVNIKGYADVAKIAGVPKNVVRNSDDYHAGIGGNPANQFCLNIYVQNQTTGQAITVLARIKIVYYCVFFARKVLAES